MTARRDGSVCFEDRLTGEPLGTYAPTSREQLDAEIATAAAAMKSWGADATARSAVLYRWADALDAAADSLSEIIIGEVAKLRDEARREVLLSADALRYNAGAAREVEGQAGMMADGSLAFVERVPVGVTSFIVPWNTPLLLLFRDLAPALAAGVTALVKPSPDAPLSIPLAIQLGRVAGLPEGVVRVVHGGAEVGERLVTHPSIRAVAFTGSTRTGAAVMAAAAPDCTRVLLELGGKGVSVILEDADLDVAVQASVKGACFTNGQMCMAVTRILAARAIFPRVLEAVVAEAAGKRVGDPRDQATDLGPLITHAHRDRVAGYVERARADAQLVWGGETAGPDELPFITPAVITDVDRHSPLVQDEIFGPVMTVEPFAGDEDATSLANASPFGLAASVWTGDVGRAWKVARGIDAGTVWINRFGALFAELPFGGMKSSGVGRTRGREGIHQFTDIRTINWAPPAQ